MHQRCSAFLQLRLIRYETCNLASILNSHAALSRHCPCALLFAVLPQQFHKIRKLKKTRQNSYFCSNTKTIKRGFRHTAIYIQLFWTLSHFWGIIVLSGVADISVFGYVLDVFGVWEGPPPMEIKAPTPIKGPTWGGTSPTWGGVKIKISTFSYTPHI